MEKIYNLPDLNKVAHAIIQMENTTLLIARDIYKQLVDDYPTLMTILYSVADEIFKPFNIVRRGTGNQHVTDLPSAFGNVLYAQTTGDKVDPKQFKGYDLTTRVILDFVTSHRVQTIGGLSWTASIIPDLLGLPKLLNDYVVLPDFIVGKNLNFQELQVPTKLERLTFPAYFFKGDSRGSGKLCYYLKDDESIHSNIKYYAVRNLLTNHIPAPTFGMIGYVYRHKEVTTFIPLCWSKHTGVIKKFYQGKLLNASPTLDFDMATLFRRIKPSKSDVVIKIPKLHKLEKSEQFYESIKSWTKRRVQILLSPASGVIKVDIKRTLRRVKIVDFLLSNTYMPIGITVKYKDQTIHIKCNVPDDIVQQGILDTYADVNIEEFQDHTLRATLVKYMDSAYHSCSCCGVGTKQLLCYTCNRGMDAVVRGTLEPTQKFIVPTVFREFNLNILDYKVHGKGELLSFTRNTEGWKGQRGLPLFPADFNFQEVG